jgi:beta-lactam-binding protein with PASTA domain
MPNFIKKTLQDAIKWSEQTGIYLNIIGKDSTDEVESDTVVGQNPEPDTDVTCLKNIDLTVAEKSFEVEQ